MIRVPNNRKGIQGQVKTTINQRRIKCSTVFISERSKAFNLRKSALLISQWTPNPICSNFNFCTLEVY